MMHQSPPLLSAARLFTLTVGLVLLAAGAQAATEHRVTLNLKLSGSSCSASFTSVHISSSDCDGYIIADALEDGLELAGLDGPGTPVCLYSSTFDEWQCAYSIPSGCTQDDIKVSVQVGTTCATNRVIGSASDASGTIGAFAFDID